LIHRVFFARMLDGDGLSTACAKAPFSVVSRGGKYFE
jgi:hypothetical protein